LERDDEWSNSRLNRGAAILYPPEPVRFFGGLLVREATAYKEKREELGATPPKPIKMLASVANAQIPKRPNV
jgi:hypothetical protein